MAVLLDQSSSIPFPQIVGNADEQSTSNKLWLRPFGFRAEDLAIDFDHTARPWLEIQILACCTTDKAGHNPEEGFFWKLGLSQRTECLLAITSLAHSSRQINVDLRCQNSKCHEEMEVEFSMQDIANIQNSSEQNESIAVEINHQLFSLRKPKGSDQLKWLSDSYRGESSAAQYMINSLLPEEQQLTFHPQGEQNSDWLQNINDAMQAMDPLVNFRINTSCPSCEKQYAYDIDFGEICLQKLQSAQNRLIETVHTLAFYYHWNDQDIFALPPWRLQRHLSLIEQESKR